MPARVWDSFLTEQDRAHLAMSKHRDIGFGERPALLLIDLYRWVYGDEPQPLLEAVKTWPGSCGLPAWEAIPHLQKLLAASRAAGIPVIHTTGVTDDVMRPWAKGSRSTRNQVVDEAAEERMRRRND